MEDCMIDDVERWAALDPPDEDEQAHLTPECLDACSEAGEHVMGCPHGPDWDIPYDWEPDFGAESGRERHEREYKEKYA
jgi:hypothetical protein